MTHEGKAGWPSVVYTSTRRSTTRQSETFFFFERGVCLFHLRVHSQQPWVVVSFRGCANPAPNRDSRVFHPNRSRLRRRGGPRATERRGTWKRTARRARVVSYRCALRGRDASRPLGWMPRRARGHRASSGGSVRSRGLTRDEADAGEARDARVEFRAGGAEHTHRAKHVPPGRGHEAET